jgi:hydrogenase maturation protease
VTVLVGGVAELYQGDLDLGRRAVEALMHDDLGPDVLVEDLSYGAVAAAQRLLELRPKALLLVGAAKRGRAAGTVERRPITVLRLPPERVQEAVASAVTGYVSIDLLLEVAHGLGALPPRVVTIEIEPARTEPSIRLSPHAEAALAEAIRLVRAEVRRL